ncbi:ribitol kinase [Saitoella complicata NRRL Y-17804]|uniref:Carbohydrate kinase FGGY C-terminal domain-containing protein n=1 Tax=Saitoella complicata (strain BCRC 22490 / CBS 7301 / JCM 7358 / NBRC 10748 / NRRL Y-17804) TaxID=698492 RepID=A0A0E9N8M8_SAICN|nr:ribitol kinase [Saitoella complicata NRRL Y-17804]ODQ55738.1 ribitol kinase [Saitoella complicata NRRL Y-17804]GAO46153.1 hypothetical protein G7K_0391-t1 [Saitoella complicata NRRL Y-17804]
MSGSESYYVGVDVGSGSARACLINGAGDILSIAVKDIKTWKTKDIHEQSADDIWGACCSVTRQVIEESKVLASTVKGIGFDATCSLVVLDRQTDAPISVSGPKFDESERNIILWADHRALDQANRINATEHNLLKYVGETMSLEMEIPKILWLKENMPTETFKKCKFYDLPDFLTYRATGDEARSFCSTVCKMSFVPPGVDDSKDGWQADFFESIGLGEFVENDYVQIGGIPDKNGRWLSAGEVVGGLSDKAAAELGLEKGTKVGSAVIDAYAGWIGTAGAKLNGSDAKEAQQEGAQSIEAASNRLAAVAGTSTCHLVCSKDPVFVPGVWGPYKDALIPDFWLAEGGQSATGSLLHHITHNHKAFPEAEAKAKGLGIPVFEYLNRRLEELRVEDNAPTIAHMARQLFMYPDFHGNRSPLADPTMRGTIIGLGMDADIDSLALQYHAAMEAIGLQTRHIIDSMNARGHKIDSIYMSGGQCKNPVLMHLIASCTGLPVIKPHYIDAAVVLGAAMLGMKAATGKDASLWSIMGECSKAGTAVFPTKSNTEKDIFEIKYGIFLSMADQQRRFRALVDRAAEGGEMSRDI